MDTAEKARIKRIKNEARFKTGLSNKQVARLLGVSQGYYNNIGSTTGLTKSLETVLREIINIYENDNKKKD